MASTFRPAAAVARLTLAPLLLGLYGCSGEATAEKKNGPPPAHVNVAPVRRGPIARVVAAVGTVVPVEVSRVASGASGKVIEYPFREGALVEKGAVLARLRDITLGIQLEAARSVLLEKSHKLRQLQAGYRPEEIAQAEATFASSKAALGLAENNARRVSELFDRPNPAVSQQEVDRATFEMEKAAQDLAAAGADLEMKRAGYRAEEVAQAEAALAAQQQMVAELEDELAKRVIEAPFTGYLVEKQTEVGEWIHLGGVVATLARLDEVEVRVNVEEAFIHDIDVGETLDVRIDALPGESFSAEVQSIIPKAEWESGSRSFPVVLRLKNPIADGRHRLQEGMTVRVEFHGPAHEALLVDKDAVVRVGQRSTVYVIGADHQAQPVEVREGLVEGNWIEVDGALSEGQMLATDGAERLRPFVPVVVESSLAAQPPATSPAQAARPAAGETSGGQ